MKATHWNTASPDHWPRKRIKYLCRFSGGGTPDTANPAYWNGDIPWVSPKDMKDRNIEDAEDHITADGLANSATKLVEPGAVLLVMRSGILRHSMPVAINRVAVALNQDMRALIPAPGLEARYLACFLQGHQKQLLCAWSKVGSTVESLESDLVGETEVPVPPLDLQRAIADYLDRETACLDSLIASKERLLGLLAEKRRALITRAVTRGLDPRAPLRDSGIPWLGEIPAHWGVRRLKFHLRSLEQGWSPMCDSTPADPGEWGVLKAGCVNGGEFDPAENKRLPDSVEPLTQYEVREGDVLMSRANTTSLLGSTALVRDVRSRLLLCDKLYRLGVDERTMCKGYLVAFLRTPVGRYEFERDATGASNSMQNIGQDSVRNLWLPVPPVDEQCTIVSRIAAGSKGFDNMRLATERTIRLLKERRAALIAAAVTGQIDVEAPK